MKMTESHLKLTPKETDILGLKRKLDLAKGIIEKGGRPSIVRAVCGISKASSLQLHREIHGKGPNAGLLPYDCDWIAKSPLNCLHASIYFNVYKKLSSSCKAPKGEIYLKSYTLYEQIAGNQPKILNINRARHICQQLGLANLCGETCHRCHITYIAIKEFPAPFDLCPICDSWVDSIGRHKWKPFSQCQKSKKTEFSSQFIFPTGHL